MCLCSLNCIIVIASYLVIPQSKQQHEFNNKTETERIHITDLLNQGV